ncbi:MAG TPA: hypothetical protein DD979_12320 [Gammaproteobacteria bacterium]|jgi:hypothetical protein|nr:hypothetical protein [Gammaproteobacteria bacterium]
MRQDMMKDGRDSRLNGLRVIRVPTEIAYAALIDANNREVEITDEMVREACDRMEDCLVYPFARLAS